MNVELLAVTNNAEKLIAKAYGICTNKDVPVENIPRWIKAGHLSPIEHASATFLVEGISRACLAQLTRHRLASFSVQSMRYCNVGGNEFVIPEKMGKWWIPYSIVIKFLGWFYRLLVKAGIPKEDARMVLPLATTTKLIMSANFREWMHIIKLRTDKSAQWEIRELAHLFLDYLIVEAPNVFKSID